MLDSNKFDPEKITIIDFKMLKGQVETPEDFDLETVEGHELNNSFQLSFNLGENLAKVDFSTSIETKSSRKDRREATGSFHFVFVYHMESLNEFAIPSKGEIRLSSELANVLASITYSTSRGVLITRLQGTAFQNFILPIVDTDKLLPKKR